MHLPDIRRPRAKKQGISEAMISVVAVGWFISAAALMQLYASTLMDASGLFRVIGLCVGIGALLLKRYGHLADLDNWGAFIFGFFAVVPWIMLALLSLNRVVGPAEVERYRVERMGGEQDLPGVYLKLENNAYEEYGTLMRKIDRQLVPTDPAEVEYRIRRGFLGFDVPLDRTLLFSPAAPGPDLPQ